jgi:antirestriction protein ArdC
MTFTKSQKSSKLSPEEVLCNDLISLMESGTPQWRKEWRGHNGEHRNPITHHEYTGSNPLLLELYSLFRGTFTPLWLTYQQGKKNGWIVKKGTKAARLLQPVPIKIEKENEETGETEQLSFRKFKVFCVFNIEDFEGIDEQSKDALKALKDKEMDLKPQLNRELVQHKAEKILKKWEVKTTHGGTRAFYSSQLDEIRMPNKESFTSIEAYLATLAHEQIHSTGHKSRLNRKLGNAFGSKDYAIEELRAEFGACILCYRLKIGSDMQNHAAYLDNWIKCLKDNHKVLFKVLSDSKKAADLIFPES